MPSWVLQTVGCRPGSLWLWPPVHDVPAETPCAGFHKPFPRKRLLLPRSGLPGAGGLPQHGDGSTCGVFLHPAPGEASRRMVGLGGQVRRYQPDLPPSPEPWRVRRAAQRDRDGRPRPSHHAYHDRAARHPADGRRPARPPATPAAGPGARDGAGAPPHSQATFHPHAADRAPAPSRRRRAVVRVLTRLVGVSV